MELEKEVKYLKLQDSKIKRKCEENDIICITYIQFCGEWINLAIIVTETPFKGPERLKVFSFIIYR